eukprot:tig00000114_g6022.t1
MAQYAADHNGQAKNPGGPSIAQMLLDAKRRGTAHPASTPHAAAAQQSFKPLAIVQQLDVFETKPMDEFSQIKRWAVSRWAASKEGCRKLRHSFRHSKLRRRLALVWSWLNHEHGVWIVNPNRVDARGTLWSSRNFRWTFDAFFEPFRGESFGQWFGIWDIFRKLSCGLIVGLVRDPSDSVNPSEFRISLQMGLLIGVIGTDLLYLLTTWPFRENIENYERVFTDSVQITVLSLLWVIGLNPQAPNAEAMSLAASILQIVAIVVIVINQIRAERNMFRAIGRRTKLFCRAVYRRSVLSSRGQLAARPTQRERPNAGAGQVRGGTRIGADLLAQPKLTHILFSHGEEEEELHAVAAKHLSRKQPAAGGGIVSEAAEASSAAAARPAAAVMPAVAEPASASLLPARPAAGPSAQQPPARRLMGASMARGSKKEPEAMTIML